MDRSLAAREDCIKMLKYHLSKTQHRMKQQVDKHRTDRTFEARDLVYARLHPYRQQSVACKTSNKLSAKFFGPFPILTRIGTMAYKLQLPETSRIHPVFHVSQLRKHVGDKPVQSPLPEVDEVGMIAC